MGCYAPPDEAKVRKTAQAEERSGRLRYLSTNSYWAWHVVTMANKNADQPRYSGFIRYLPAGEPWPNEFAVREPSLDL